MADNTYRIAAVTALENHVLRVEYVGGTVIEVDLTELIGRSRPFKPLADPALFARVKVGDYGWSVEWEGSDDAVLDSARVFEMALNRHTVMTHWPSAAGRTSTA